MSSRAAVVLAGGRATRLGGMSKPSLTLGGQTLLQRCLAAARSAGCERIIVVGPVTDAAADVTWVREDPPFGGPAAALATAVPLVREEEVLVLAGDLARPDRAVGLLCAAPLSGDGAYLVDGAGRAQWLTGRYRTAALAAVVAARSSQLRDASVRALFQGLDLAEVPAPSEATADIDTWEDYARARNVDGGTAASEEVIMAKDSPRTLPPEALDAWAGALRERFGLSEADLPVALILDLARDVANDVARPAAPFSAYVAGLVAGRAGGTPDQVRRAVAEVTELARAWSAD